MNLSKNPLYLTLVARVKALEDCGLPGRVTTLEGGTPSPKPVDDEIVPDPSEDNAVAFTTDELAEGVPDTPDYSPLKDDDTDVPAWLPRYKELFDVHYAQKYGQYWLCLANKGADSVLCNFSTTEPVLTPANLVKFTNGLKFVSRADLLDQKFTLAVDFEGNLDDGTSMLGICDGSRYFFCREGGYKDATRVLSAAPDVVLKGRAPTKSSEADFPALAMFANARFLSGEIWGAPEVKGTTQIELCYGIDTTWKPEYKDDKDLAEKHWALKNKMDCAMLWYGEFHFQEDQENILFLSEPLEPEESKTQVMASCGFCKKGDEEKCPFYSKERAGYHRLEGLEYTGEWGTVSGSNKKKMNKQFTGSKCNRGFNKQ